MIFTRRVSKDVQLDVWRAIRDGDVVKLERHLKRGVSPNLKQGSRVPEDRVLLHAAANFGQAEVIRLLARRGARLQMRDADHVTPLGVAIVREMWDAARALVECGADVRTGLRVLLHPWGYWHQVMRSTRHGVTTRDYVLEAVGQIEQGMGAIAKGRCPRWTREWIDADSGMMAAAWSGGSALHSAAQRGSAAAVLMLLEAGYECNALNADGKTAREMGDTEVRAAIDAWQARQAVRLALMDPRGDALRMAS